MLADIQFVSYYLSKIEFKFSPDSEEIREKNLSFRHSIEYMGDEKVKVSIDCKITDDSGLFLRVVIHGFFVVQLENGSDEIHYKKLCERNTLSILFPYLRSAVSDISLKANSEPIIIPTINILNMLDAVDEELSINKQAST